MNKYSEKVNQTAVMDYLAYVENKYKNLFYFHSPVGKITTVHGRHFIAGREGLHDITVCHEGRYIGIEMKSYKGKQKPKQKIIENIIKNAGGEYYVINEVEQIREIIPI